MEKNVEGKSLSNSSDQETCELEPKLKYGRTSSQNSVSKSAPRLEIDEIIPEGSGSECCDTSNTITTFPQDYKRITVQSNQHINNLPKEILLTMFSFLSRSDRLSTAALACSYWHGLTLDPCLWRVCIFINEQQLNDAILQRVLTYSSNVKTLILIRCPQVTDKGLSNSMDNCRNVTELQILS